MDIVSYLLELIETRKNVGIIELGTIFKKKTPGRYDSKTSSFLPPKYEIAFTNEVKEEENLILFISEKRNISNESAKYYITEFVEGIKAQLADHQQADFSPIGQLKIVNDEIVLESAAEIGFSSFGLPSISTQPKPVESEPEAEESEVEEPTIPETIEEAPQIQETDEQPIFDDEQAVLEQEHTSLPTDILDPLWRPTVINRYEYDEEDEDEEKGGWFGFTIKAVLTVIIVLSVIGAIMFFAYPNLFQTVKEKITTPTQVDNEPIVMVDTNAAQKIDSPKTDTLEKAPIINTPKDTIATPKTVNKVITYEIIGSAMKTQKKVDEVITNLAKRGVKAKKMEAMPGRLIKISLGTFTDFNLAKKYQDSLKVKLKNPDIYIQTIKPKN